MQDDVHGAPVRSLADGVPADTEHLLRSMLVIRQFEESVMLLFQKNMVRGSTHLYQGQEAVAVGVCSRLRHGDTMTHVPGSWRSARHGSTSR